MPQPPNLSLEKLAQQLKAAFDLFYPAPLEAWHYFASCGKLVHYAKNSIVKAAHAIDKYGYFLVEGVCGLFVWKENSAMCLDLLLENNFFADDLSLFTGKPSPVEIVALENTLLLRLPKSQIVHLQQTPMGQILFAAGNQAGFVEKQQQQLDESYYEPAPATPVKPKVTKPPAKAAAKPPANPALPQKSASAAAAKPLAEGPLSCEKATSLVSGYGFSSVEAATCSGKLYAFNAKRGANSFAIKLDPASGQLTEVKKLP